MKLTIVAGAVLALGTSVAFAGDHGMSEAAKEFKAGCKAYQAETGSANSDCGCLAKAVDKDAELAAAFAAITTTEQLEAAPENVKAALAACPAS